MAQIPFQAQEFPYATGEAKKKKIKKKESHSFLTVMEAGESKIKSGESPLPGS